MSTQKPSQPKKAPEPPELPADDEAIVIDHDKTGEIPSVSKLLNRKKVLKALEKEKEEKTKTSKLKRPEAPPHIELSTASSTQIQVKKPLEIQKTRLKGQTKALMGWDLKQLKTSSDPMAKGLSLLFEQGMSEAALFLAIQNQASSQIFAAFAGVQLKAGAWSGLTWEPKVFPEIWKSLVSRGYMEFAPDSKNVNRVAFDVGEKQWLTLIRVGMPTACRGLIAIISKVSLALPLQKALPLLFADPKQAPLKKAA